jgi:hypothetical protein
VNAERTWLTLLNGATNYGELQNAFEHMIVDAQATGNSEAMIASIDEAIRRIEQERARDQAELDGFESDYESFKQEQSGVIGWFKRKMPFTETRKKELGHRDTLSDQQAEVLADNFVIARAQMLKERIAPPKLRKMGAKPNHWREAFLGHESHESISDYGRVILDLGNELQNTNAFLKSLQSDIESFASARFSTSDDQKRSQEDLKAAKEELKLLFDESQEKQSLRAAALVHLKDLLIQDLSEKDSGFKQANDLLLKLRNLQTLHPRLAKLLADRLAITKTIVSKMLERDKLPEQAAKLEQSIRTLKRDYEDAEQKRLQSARDLDGPNQLYQSALSEWQRADSALKATKSLYDAYVAEQAKQNASNAAEVASDGDFGVSASSSVVAEYRRLEENAAQAKRELDSRTPVFEQAKRSSDLATKEVKEIQSKLDTQAVELKNLTDKESQLQQWIQREERNLDSASQESQDAGQAFLRAMIELPRFEKSHPVVRTIQEILEDLHRTGGTRPPTLFDHISLPFQNKSFSSSSDSNQARAGSKITDDRERQSESLESAIREIDKLIEECKQESARLAKSRKETLQRRGQMLLDQRVLNELDFDEVQ